MSMCDLAKRYAPLVGRVLLANLFIVAGYNKISGFAVTAEYMSAKMSGLDPALIKLLLLLTILIELGGGLMLLLGWQIRLAAAVIFLWMIPVTFIFHAYWGLPAEQMQTQFIQFQKNMAIMGGLLYFMAFGPGHFSLGRDPCA